MFCHSALRLQWQTSQTKQLSDHFLEMISIFRIESDIMKRQFISLFICAITAVGGLFIAFNPAVVSAETNEKNFVGQAEVNTLVAMAIPPYKW